MRIISLCFVISLLLFTQASAEFYLVPGGGIKPDGALTYGIPATPFGPAPVVTKRIYTDHVGSMYWMSYPFVPVPVQAAPGSNMRWGWSGDSPASSD